MRAPLAAVVAWFITADPAALSRALGTDGGVQKEAYFYAVPCVTLRDETEWTELVDMGWNRIVSPSTQNISGSIINMIGKTGAEGSPYGNGNAGVAICERLLNT